MYWSHNRRIYLLLLYFWLYYLGKILKSLIYSNILFSADLEERYSQLMRKFFSFLSRNLPLPVCKITFVPQYHFTHMFTSVFLNTIYPTLHVIEGVFIWYWVRKYYPIRTSIVVLCDCSKSVLTCCVPDCEFYLFIIDLQSFYFKIHTNRRVMQ